MWMADAHRGDGKRFIVRADEKLSVFVELESTRVLDARRFIDSAQWSPVRGVPDSL
jgi:hypothetical protein